MPANDVGLWVNAGNSYDLICTLREGDPINPSVNDSKKIKTLVSFAVGAGSPGQGRGWLTDPADLYALDAKQLLQLPGFAEKSAQNLLDGIAASMSQGLGRVLAGLTIRHVGVSNARLLA